VIATIVISTVVLMLVAAVIFLLARYLPIIANLLTNVTVRRARGEHDLLEGETVTFTTSDGVRLVGTLTPAPKGLSPKGTVPVQEALVVGDSPLRGQSPVTLSPAPRRDDLSDVPVALFGVSRGATAALIAAADETDVAAVVSDSAFSTPHTLHSYMRRWAPIFVDPGMLLLSAPDWVFSVFRLLGARLAEHHVGVRFVPLVPALRRLRAPVLFLHGEGDNYIAKEQAEMLYRHAAGPKELWIVPHADHNRAVDAAPVEYGRRITRFLRVSLDVAEPAVTTVG